MNVKFLLNAFMLLCALQAGAQSVQVTGKVNSLEDGTPLPGVNIVVKGTTKGSTSDADGTYRVDASANDVLIFSFIGFIPEEVSIGNRSVVNVSLTPDIQHLSEVVVIGYGEQSKRNLTGSVSTISSQDVQNVSVSTVEGVLQGRASGVMVTQTSGELGGGVSLRVRGPSSISASSQPLYVIDGVPIIQAEDRGGSPLGAGTTPSQTPLINLNPNDIASMSILKDADATAIYGARGTNGVVLITTKQGEPGKTKINLGYYAGIQEETNRYKMLNGQQYSDLWNTAGVNWFESVRPDLRDLLINLGFGQNSRELWFNNNATPLIFGQPLAIQRPDTLPSTNWLDLTHRKGFVQEFNASMSGGDQKTKFFIGGTYRDEESYLLTNELKRYSLRANLSHELSNKLGMQLMINPSRVDNTRIAQGGAGVSPILYATIFYPNVSAVDKKGEPNTNVSPNPFQQFGSNPLQSVSGNDIKSTNTRVLSNLNFNYKITKDLVFRMENAVDFLQLQEIWKFPVTTVEGRTTNGSNNSRNEQTLNWNINNTFTYTKDWKDHKLTALAGVSFQEVSTSNFSASGVNFATPALQNLSSASEITSGTGEGTSFAFTSYLARANYLFKNRYLVTLSGRYDGSSVFPQNNRYGFFPAISGGWILSEENFLPRSISFLKLRSSYGKTGNASGIGDFPSLGLLNTGANYNGQPGIIPSQIENRDLKWETTAQFDVGLEFGLFDNALSGTLAYYHKKTTGLLLGNPVPLTSGFPSVVQNIGEMENKGIEIDLKGSIFSKGAFKWDLGLNIATLQNTVTRLNQGQDIISAFSIIREGEPLGAFYLVEYAGVDAANGNALFKDIDGNDTSRYNLAARKIAGKPFPDYFGGITSNMQYKGFDLSVFFQFSQGNEAYSSERSLLSSNLASIFNQTTDQLDYWTPENRDATVPQPRLFTGNGNQNSTRYLSDASYIRLKTISLGYTLPSSLTKGATIRMYAQAQNLFTITNFEGLDPEVSGNGTQSFAQGVSFFTAPTAKTITFGVNVSF
jgi:TonB-dependent starch-binding outer membrane protein SusC